jgi:hypothetical protein
MMVIDNIWNAIAKIGYENVVQVVTNNAIVPNFLITSGAHWQALKKTCSLKAFLQA